MKRSEYFKEYYARNWKKMDAYTKAYCAANPEKRAAYGKAWRVANREKKSAYDKAWKAANPKRAAWAMHKVCAKKRGIPFHLTFDQWCSIWNPYWHLRDGTGNMAMARHLDEGDYEIGNVRIITRVENATEQGEFKRAAEMESMRKEAADK